MHLNEDMILCVLNYLDSEVDLARAASVSHSWRKQVVEGGLWKRLCLKRFPELGLFKEVLCEDASSSCTSALEREHLVYSRLYSRLVGTKQRSCIVDTLAASSTDNPPDEDIAQTLHPEAKLGRFPSYWSSNGQSKTEVPETLTYRLVTPLCVVQEIRVRAFEAYFQEGHPIYSSQYVRFKMGYSTSPSAYLWTYTSPMYPMLQVSSLQAFILPRPVVCIGGILQVELLGRVQTQKSDELYYICITHVNVQGSPIFGSSFTTNKEGQLVLTERKVDDAGNENEELLPSRWFNFADHLRRNQMRYNLQRNINLFLNDYDLASDEEDENEDDEDEDQNEGLVLE